MFGRATIGLGIGPHSSSLRSPVMDDENVRPVGDALILALLRASSLQRTCTTYPKVAPGPGAISKWVSK